MRLIRIRRGLMLFNFAVIVFGLKLMQNESSLIVDLPIRIDPASHVDKRSNIISNVIQNNYPFIYLANISIGTPGQSIRLAIDTGSSDTIVYSGGQRDGDSSLEGDFDPSKSNTYSTILMPYFQTYGQGQVMGQWGTDIFQWGDVTLQKFQFASIKSGTVPYALIGLYPYTKESTIIPYSNFPQALVDHGYTKSSAFSVHLNSPTSQEGSIQFGGYDKSKFIGPMYKVPITSITESFSIQLTGLESGFQNLLEGFQLTSQLKTVLLDTGTTWNYLPKVLTDKIAQIYQASYNSDFSAYTMPCTESVGKPSIEFSFLGASITMTSDHIVVPIQYAATPGQPYDKSQCALTFYPLNDLQVQTNIVLGQAFMRAAYIVYNSAKGEIGLANSAVGLTGSSEPIEISGSIPNIDWAPEYNENTGSNPLLSLLGLAKL